MDTKNNIRKLRNQFLKSYYNNDYLNAQLLGERLIAMYKDNHITDTESYGDDLFNLACAYDEDGLLDKALSTYLKAADAVSFDGSSQKLSDIYNNLAIVYSNLHQTDMALAYFKKCYNIRYELLPHNHTDVITACYNLGSMYKSMGRFYEAIQYYAKALASRSLKDICYADNLYNLGMCYVESDDFSTGLNYMQEAVDIYKTITDNQTEYITALSFYSSILYKVGKYTEALKNYNTLITLIKSHYGTNQPFYADAVSKLADCYAGLNQIERAIPLKQKALNMIKKSVGTDHLFYSGALAELGEYYLRESEYSKAAELYNKALETRKKVLGISEDECISYIQTLSDIYIAMALPQKAEDLLSYALNNIEPTSKKYTHLVLELVRLYMDTENGAGLNKAFGLFNKVHPEKSFDEMLDMAEDLE